MNGVTGLSRPTLGNIQRQSSGLSPNLVLETNARAPWLTLATAHARYIWLTTRGVARAMAHTRHGPHGAYGGPKGPSWAPRGPLGPPRGPRDPLGPLRPLLGGARKG